MLRCVMEGFTYLKSVDTDKLIKDYQLKGINQVCASPLVFRGKSQWKETQEHRPQLRRLMKLLNIKPYYIIMQKNKFVITEE